LREDSQTKRQAGGMIKTKVGEGHALKEPTMRRKDWTRVKRWSASRGKAGVTKPNSAQEKKNLLG